MADYFTANLENMVLRSIIERYHLYKRYMYNTFIICKEDRNLNEILNRFSNCHHSLQFNLEAEANEEFHFLDVRLKRTSDGSLQGSIYKNGMDGIRISIAVSH